MQLVYVAIVAGPVLNHMNPLVYSINRLFSDEKVILIPVTIGVIFHTWDSWRYSGIDEIAGLTCSVSRPVILVVYYSVTESYVGVSVVNRIRCAWETTGIGLISGLTLKQWSRWNNLEYDWACPIVLVRCCIEWNTESKIMTYWSTWNNTCRRIERKAWR